MEELLTGESSSIEYKQEVPSNSEKYLKTIIAFANGNGGQMVFGIEDKTCQVVGIPQDVVRQIKSTTIRHFILTRIAEKRSNKAYYKHLIRQIK